MLDIEQAAEIDKGVEDMQKKKEEELKAEKERKIREKEAEQQAKREAREMEAEERRLKKQKLDDERRIKMEAKEAEKEKKRAEQDAALASANQPAPVEQTPIPLQALPPHVAQVLDGAVNISDIDVQLISDFLTGRYGSFYLYSET